MCCVHVIRVVQIGKALQDQQWLFENLMMQVEERRSSVENSAKQIEDRLVSTHTVLISRQSKSMNIAVITNEILLEM